MRGTTKNALCFGHSNAILQGYVDFDMAGDKYGKRSTIEYVFTIGWIVVNWISKLHKVIALSTTKEKSVAMTKSSKEMILLQRFMKEIGKK